MCHVTKFRKEKLPGGSHEISKFAKQGIFQAHIIGEKFQQCPIRTTMLSIMSEMNTNKLVENSFARIGTEKFLKRKRSCLNHLLF